MNPSCEMIAPQPLAFWRCRLVLRLRPPCAWELPMRDPLPPPPQDTHSHRKGVGGVQSAPRPPAARDRRGRQRRGSAAPSARARVRRTKKTTRPPPPECTTHQIRRNGLVEALPALFGSGLGAFCALPVEGKIHGVTERAGAWRSQSIAPPTVRASARAARAAASASLSRRRLAPASASSLSRCALSLRQRAAEPQTAASA